MLASFNLPGGSDEVNEINGGNGKDNLVGSEERDLISGGNGRDTLTGLDGDDSLNGGNGRDLLIGGNGNDVLNGGNGKDTFVIAPGQGMDIIEDFNNDSIGLTDGLTFSDLTFSGSNILLGEEILATLTDIDTIISAADFTAI